MSDKTTDLSDFDIPQSTLVIAPNASVAEALLNRAMKKHRSTSLCADNILSLPNWLNRSLAENQIRSIASDIQLLFIWEEVIAGMDLDFDMHAPTLAPLALQAWQYLHLWQVPSRELAQAEYSQEVQFSRWCRAFEAQLAKSNLQTLEQLAEEQLKLRQDKPIKKILLVNFVEPPAPLWLNLMEHLAEDVGTLTLSSATGLVAQHAADDTDDEISAAAEWVNQRLTAKPTARIGVISTQDKNLLSKIERELWLREISARSRKPLRAEGIVEAALRLLKLNNQKIELADARAIVQSPFFGNHPEDLGSRALWEKRICALETRTLSRSDFFQCVKESEELIAIRESIRKQPTSLSPIEWADIFQQQLACLNWPGTRSLNRSQAQAKDEWLELLGELATLGYVYPSMSAGKALQSLTRLAEKRVRQTGSPRSRVHLLDRVEAATDYDYLWIFGCDDEHWPGAVSPQPLLPIGIQNTYAMPRCSAEQELELSKKLLASLKYRADEVVCSFTRSDGDQKRQLTPLLHTLPNLNLSLPEQVIQTAEFEFVDCSKAPPLQPDQRQVKGGSRLMQLMAASPFDAFALYRLNATPLGLPSEGVTPMQMGQLIHDLLDRLWSDISNRKELETRYHTDLDALITKHVEGTLRGWKGARRIGTRQTRLVANRLEDLLREWLPLELQRNDFAILDTERSLVLEIGGIALSLRIDRIDQTDRGLLLIDYKSGGSGSIEDWRSSPPNEPQLPLYSIALSEKAVGVAFAKIRKGEMKWISLGKEELLHRMRIEENWGELQLMWHSELTQLAESFASGDTRVRETNTGFFQKDPLRALHRFSEQEELEKCQSNK